MPLSGKEVVKILEKRGFKVSRQKGSHIVLHKISAGKKLVAVVPNHKEIQRGTLRSIAKMTGVNKEELGV